MSLRAICTIGREGLFFKGLLLLVCWYEQNYIGATGLARKFECKIHIPAYTFLTDSNTCNKKSIFLEKMLFIADEHYF